MEERTVVDPGFGPAGYGAPQAPPYGAGGEATQVFPGGPAGYAQPGYQQPGYAPPGYDVTQQAVGQTCPICQTPNPPMERFCQDCGLMFGSTSNDVAPLGDTADAARLVGADGRDFVLEAGMNVVGRESVDVVLMDPTVSRRHAQVKLDGTQVIVEDLGSTNGTFVGGRQIRPGEQAMAYHGDVVKFGSVQLTVTLPGAPARPAALPAPSPQAAAPAADRGPVVAQAVLADGSQFPLYAGANSVGRRSGNDLVLVDAFASGKHAEIRIEEGSATVVDVGSTNGTFFNGARMAPNAPQPLANGESVTFGKTVVTLQLAGAAPAEAAEVGAPEPTRAFTAPTEAAPVAEPTVLPGA